ncbi:hypothetical protein L6R29_06650 [Myxococcota bacterium]|nr:hypothetical protein [Myxococcota bacterium]
MQQRIGVWGFWRGVMVLLWGMWGVACQPPQPSLLCETGKARCGEACVDVTQDPKHCGVCGAVCRSEERCDKGLCVLRCAAGTQDCAGNCVDILASEKHCGACAKACATGERCFLGRCVSACPPNLPDLCEGTCVDKRSDRKHCGACGEICAVGRVCQEGGCRCPIGQFLCGSTCVDPMTSTQHCGDCKRPCAEGQICASGTCVPSCPSATPTTCFGGCVDTQSHRLHCGGCGRVCLAGQSCSAGKCLCAEDITECGDRCVDLTSDYAHCGACGAACAGGQLCAFGGCVTSCPAATPTACFGGCVDTQSNRLHCGACGTACGAGQSCIQGKCVCPPNQKLCDGVCVDPRANFQHCGTCMQICAMGEVCGDAKCQIQCPAATATICFGGCVDLQSDTLHCGGCGKRCGFGTACEKGQCVCAVGFALCGGRCQDLQNARAHCGACGKACGPTESCVKGACEPVCLREAPTRCGALCVDTKQDARHCGSCDKACAQGERCRDGQCVPECPVGQTLCAGQCFDLQRSLQHCGTCGNACAAGSVCKAGRCDCVDGAVRSCYEAPAATKGVGPCVAGEQRCTAGVWGPCTGQVLPSIEIKDGVDNDCDGMVDESVQVQLFAGNSLLKNGGLLEARFHQPAQIVSDSAGNLYLADTANHMIRKIDPQGNVTTFAGTGVPAFKDGTALQATFQHPEDLAFDSKGNLYIADTGNHAIRMIDLQGNVKTIAGAGKSGFQDGSGGQALFFSPRGIAFDKNGTLFVADTGNHAIRKVDPQGQVSLIAGNGVAGFSDGTGKMAQFDEPTDLVIDSANNLYVADSQNHRIRKVDDKGVVTTFAGAGLADFLDGKAQQARFKAPRGLLLDGAGNLYVADAFNHRIRKIDAQGNVSTLAGTGNAGFKDDTGLNAQLYRPSGLALDNKGDLMIVDTENKRVRKLSLNTGIVTTLTGDDPRGFVDGSVGQAKFNRVSAVTTDLTNGDVFVADSENHRIRNVDPKGLTTTLSGTGQAGYLDGDAATARFQSPRGLVFSHSSRMLYVADTRNHRIRIVDLQGKVTTLAGDGTAGLRDGAAMQANFREPQGLALDEAANLLYVADTGNHVIRLIDLAAGQVKTYAGDGTLGFVDADATKARFAAPQGIAWQQGVGLLVADTQNVRIRLVDTKQQVRTVAGAGKVARTDGEALRANFLEPIGLLVGRDKRLYITDQTSIRWLEKGRVQTFVGASYASYLDGDISVASFGQIWGLVQRYDGALVAADQGYHHLRLIQ